MVLNNKNKFYQIIISILLILNFIRCKSLQNDNHLMLSTNDENEYITYVYSKDFSNSINNYSNKIINGFTDDYVLIYNLKGQQRLKNGKTRLMEAAEKNNIFYINSIHNIQSIINLEDNNKNTALFYAVNNGKYEATELLLKKGAIITHKNNQNENILHIALRKINLNNMNISFIKLIIDYARIQNKIKELFKYEKEKEIQSRQSFPLLHYFIFTKELKYLEIIKEDLQNGNINLYTKDYEGKTALDNSIEVQASLEIFKFLTENGVNDNEPPIDNNSLLMKSQILGLDKLYEYIKNKL